MTNLKTYILILFVLAFTININAQDEQAERMLKWANQGAVTNQNYNSEIPFRYVDGYIFVDIVQNDKTYNFLFDTGAEATLIDKAIINEFGFKTHATSTISGPVVKNGAVNTIVVSSITISDVDFVNIGAVAINLEFVKAKFCEKVDGIIGSNLMKKAKWQIDYDKKVIRLSNDISNLLSQHPEYTLNTILPSRGWGTETIELNIDGYVSQFDFDTGNGREKIVLNPNKLKEFTSIDKASVLEYGIKKSAADYKFIAQNVIIGDIKLANQSISLEKEVGNLQLLGNRFFEKFIVTIDWEKHQIYLEPTKEIMPDQLNGFELVFKPNFESNKIEIATGLKTYTKENKIEEGAILLKVSETDVSNFSHQEFCDFWTMEWPKIIDAEKLNIVISHKRKSKELVINKKKLS